jgi:hypothetical protein
MNSILEDIFRCSAMGENWSSSKEDWWDVGETGSIEHEALAPMRGAHTEDSYGLVFNDELVRTKGEHVCCTCHRPISIGSTARTCRTREGRLYEHLPDKCPALEDKIYGRSQQTIGGGDNEKD